MPEAKEVATPAAEEKKEEVLNMLDMIKSQRKIAENTAKLEAQRQLDALKAAAGK